MEYKYMLFSLNCFKQERLTVSLIVAIVFVFLSGCKQEKDARQMIAENSCKEIMESEAFPGSTRKKARKVLGNWKNSVVDPEPVLVHAGYGKDPCDGQSLLFLTMSDEDFNISGFAIREVHQNPGPSQILVIKDQYPVFPKIGKGEFALIRFQKRQLLTDRKVEHVWSEYSAQTPNAQRLAYSEKKSPAIFISYPDAENIEIELWVYDYSGNVSGSVQLEQGLPREIIMRYDKENTP